MKRTWLPAAGPLRGVVRVPGDKSISHRAVLFAAMARGTSRLSGVLDSADVRCTIAAVRALGATVEECGSDETGLSLAVTGWGPRGPVEPAGPVDCGNSGTTARLLLGLLAGWPIQVTLVGDDSLSRRPMRRVIVPLAAMGASFESDDGCLPITIRGSSSPRALRYDSPHGSAQVKTAVLLAGLRARGSTSVQEPVLSRDHTERMLPVFGVAVQSDQKARWCGLTGPAQLAAHDVAVPGDPSSAAFLLGAAALVPGSEVELVDVALNPTRAGAVGVLQRMGASIDVSPGAPLGDEPVGTLMVRHVAGLKATRVTADEVPSLVDEVPLLAVVATAAEGTTHFAGIGELRVKESDRLEAIAAGLSALGVTVRHGVDRLEVDGPGTLHAAPLDSLGDHRLAMAWAVAALAADGGVEIDRWDSVDVSYPGFAADLDRLLAGEPPL